jgi:hypothetical protein
MTALGEATRVYQVTLEALRAHMGTDAEDDLVHELVDADRAMEVAWLEDQAA